MGVNDEDACIVLCSVDSGGVWGLYELLSKDPGNRVAVLRCVFPWDYLKNHVSQKDQGCDGGAVEGLRLATSALSVDQTHE